MSGSGRSRPGRCYSSALPSGRGGDRDVRYVYDAEGQLAAEYGTPTDSDTSYLAADHLGSIRLVTDATGAVKKCYDYYPFGEDIASGTGGRSSCFANGIYPSNPSQLV